MRYRIQRTVTLTETFFVEGVDSPEQARGLLHNRDYGMAAVDGRIHLMGQHRDELFDFTMPIIENEPARD